MRWRIRRIVNGCAARQLVARRDVIAPEFISYGLVIRAINRKLCLKQGLTNLCSSPPERCSCSVGFSRVTRSVRGFMSGRELNSMLPCSC